MRLRFAQMILSNEKKIKSSNIEDYDIQYAAERTINIRHFLG